ncbi:hypothetical protein MCEMIEM13_01265 [Comamonadaceae bacterium]
MRDRNVIFVCLSFSFWIHVTLTFFSLFDTIPTTGITTNIRSTQVRLISASSNRTSISLEDTNASIGTPMAETHASGGYNKQTQVVRAKETHDSGTHFYARSEVSVPALPVGEWAIVWSLWPSDKARTIRFKLWVSDHGKIVKWELLEQPEDFQLIKGVLSTIGDTPMNPAILNGSPVASVQNIELEFIPD